MASRQLLGWLAAGLLVSGLASGIAEAAGPWKGQIVDRDSGQPIPGAVVLAIWKVRSRESIHPEDTFHSAFEVVSDDEGRFVIPEHDPKPTKPLTATRGPEIVIFKGGYGTWAFQGGPYYPQAEDSNVRRQRIDAAWEQFGKGGAVIELRPLRERRQRLDWNSSVRPPRVPDDQMLRLLNALDEELIALGIPPFHVPKEIRR